MGLEMLEGDTTRVSRTAGVTETLAVLLIEPEVAVMVTLEVVTARAVANPALLMLTLLVSELLQTTDGLGLCELSE